MLEICELLHMPPSRFGKLEDSDMLFLSAALNEKAKRMNQNG